MVYVDKKIVYVDKKIVYVDKKNGYVEKKNGLRGRAHQAPCETMPHSSQLLVLRFKQLRGPFEQIIAEPNFHHCPHF